MVENSGEKRANPKVGHDRKVLEISGAHYINIPRDFVVRNRIRAGDVLTVVTGLDILKVVVPGN